MTQPPTRWRPKGNRLCITKSINFYQDQDQDLLHWSEARPEKFSDFVKTILRQAMQTQTTGRENTQPAGPTLNPATLRQIIQDELAALTLAPAGAAGSPNHPATPPNPDPEHPIDDTLRTQLLSF